MLTQKALTTMCLAVTLGVFACEDDSNGLLETEETEEALIALDNTTFWSGTIRICYKNKFDNPLTEDAADRFEDTLLSTWAAVAEIPVTFHDDCWFLTGQTRIEIEFDQQNNWKVAGSFGLGQPAAGQANAGSLGYCDASLPGADCTYKIEQERAMVVHEFGHALGFLHMQQHPERPSDLESWCTWITEPTGLVQPVDTNGIEVGPECADGLDNDGDGLTDCEDDGRVPASGCFAVCEWNRWFTNNAIVNQQYVNPYSNEPRKHEGHFFTKYDPVSATTYCKDTDGEHTGELEDNSDHGYLSQSNIATIQLIYGAKGEPRYVAGELHARAGFAVDGKWLVGDGGVLTPQWRAAGVLDAEFQSPRWYHGSGSTAGLEINNTVLNDGEMRTIYFLFKDFKGSTRLAWQTIERNDAKHSALVSATVM